MSIERMMPPHEGNPYDTYDSELYQRVLNETECEKQLTYLSNSSLILPFIDATARIPSGLMKANIIDLGDYYECLSIDKRAEDMHFEGKYCIIEIPFLQKISMPSWFSLAKLARLSKSDSPLSMIDEYVTKVEMLSESITSSIDFEEMRKNPIAGNIALQLGTCIPKVCTVTQVEKFMTPPIPLPKIKYELGPCRLPGDKMYSTADYVALGIFGTLILLTILSTCYDLYQVFIKKKTTRQPLLTSMSVYTNTKRLINFPPPKNPLYCVDGIRAISIYWVVCCHAYAFHTVTPIHNLTDIVEWSTKFTSTWIVGGPISVDTFFLLTGLLCVYGIPKTVTPMIMIKSLHKVYIFRLFRTWPLLAAAVLLQASVFHWIMDGPDWNKMAFMVDLCRKRWWATLLHVQNYIRPSGVCLFQSWYLAVDTQLYFLSPFISIFLLSSSKMAWSALGVALTASLAIISYHCFYYQYPSVLIGLWFTGNYNDFYLNFYMNTFVRASPFVVGMIYGHILRNHKDKRLTMSAKKVFIGWTLSLMATSYCFFLVNVMRQIPYETTFYDLLYNSVMRALWAAGIGWMILASVHGYGGPINWFLSLPMWRLPSRISYGVYVIHVQIIMLHTSSATKSTYFSDFNMIYMCASYILLSSLAAFFLCVLIDAPTSTFMKLLLESKLIGVKHLAESNEDENNDLKSKL